MLPHNQVLLKVSLYENYAPPDVDPPRFIQLSYLDGVTRGTNLSGEELFQLNEPFARVLDLRQQLSVALGVHIRRLAVFEGERCQNNADPVVDPSTITVRDDPACDPSAVICEIRDDMMEELRAELSRQESQVEVSFLCHAAGPGSTFREW